MDTVSAPAARQALLLRPHARGQGEVDRLLEQGEGGAENVLFDPNAWCTDGSGLARRLGARLGRQQAWPSPARTTADEATLYVMDVATGQEVEADVIEGAKYAEPLVDAEGRRLLLHLAPDRRGNAGGRSAGLRRGALPRARHRSEDGHARAPADRQPVDLPRRRLRATAVAVRLSVQHGWNATDVYFRTPAESDEGRRFREGRRPAKYDGGGLEGRASTSLTDEGAPRQRVFKRRPENPERAAWKEIVPEGPTDALDSVSVVGGQLALDLPAERGQARCEVRDARRQAGAQGRAARHRRGERPVGLDDEDEAYYAFSSFTTRRDPHDVDEDRQERALGEVKLPGRHLDRTRSSRCSTRRRTARRSRCSSSTART